MGFGEAGPQVLVKQDMGMTAWKCKVFSLSLANRSCCARIAPNNTGDLGRLALRHFFRVIEYVLILISLEQLSPGELMKG